MQEDCGQPDLIFIDSGEEFKIETLVPFKIVPDTTTTFQNTTTPKEAVNSHSRRPNSPA
jgi:hypothetical protein